MLKKWFIWFVVGACVLPVMSSNAQQADPFIKTWLHQDGVNTYQLIVSNSRANHTLYRVSYRLFGESFESDLCRANSSNVIQCPGAVYLTRDDARHVTTLESSSRKYDFYDPEFLPLLSDVFGKWKANEASAFRTAQHRMEIRMGDKPTEVMVATSSQDSLGNTCSDLGGTAFQVTTLSDGSQTFRCPRPSCQDEGFRFIPEKKQLIALSSNQALIVGLCVQTESSTVFEKE